MRGAPLRPWRVRLQTLGFTGCASGSVGRGSLLLPSLGLAGGHPQGGLWSAGRSSCLSRGSAHRQARAGGLEEPGEKAALRSSPALWDLHFLRLSNIPLPVSTLFIHLSDDGHFGGFPVLPIMNNVEMYMRVQVSLRYCFYFHWIYTAMGLLHHMGVLCVVSYCSK